ncbi:phage head completion protein [Staphylococcus felis]|uniref:phage head completion protein n=1 Tax=Staphylococcus felis TaxID=46127 RepID=UPI000E235CE8|nr:head-tail adaptor protein [Staphylococcus felis]REI31455.1 hypothetical protein DOS80_05955 [Staphylococcus felis]
MEIGKLKHRIEIIEIIHGVDDEGTYTEIEKVLMTPFAEISKTTIKEFRSKELDGRKGVIDFIIRYQQRANIDSGMIVKFKNKRYEIKNVEIDFQDYERMMLKCEVIE